MPTSTIILIYEIMDNKYKMESIWLCVLWAQLGSILFLSFGRTGCNTIYSLFWRKVSFLIQRGKVESKKEYPFFLSLFHLFIKEGEAFCLLSGLMMVLSVIITFLLRRLPSVIYHVVISLRWATLPLTLR